MELTQRLECTQELFTNKCEKRNPEQIGFLGICGAKYPLKKGPNKIGRDPETCNIVLNLNSISRQHAVINILNSNDYMLMDLDSSNKTKISDKVLSPYIPHALKNGDMVQFGQVFGVFRLLEEESDLPMTQAIDVPETPVNFKYVSKSNSILATIVPESPDVSDRDDSFIGASQPKQQNAFKSPKNNLTKPSGKTIAMEQIETNKIDNIYWRSSKKSDTFCVQSKMPSIQDDSEISLRISGSGFQKNIHELDTQIPYNNHDESTKSISNANIKISENPSSPNINNVETQMPITENLTEICKLQNPQNVPFDFCTENKENHKNIFNAETQILDVKETISTSRDNTDNDQSSLLNSREDNTSSDIILFDEIDDKPLPDISDSQPLLTEELLKINKQLVSVERDTESENLNYIPLVRTNRFKSDSSTDCEDINDALTQKISVKVEYSKDLTDCVIEHSSNKPNKKQRKSPLIDDDSTDCEDNLNENDIMQPNNSTDNVKFEDLPTQIIDETNENEAPTVKNNENIFEDAATQIIELNKSDSTEPPKQNSNFEDAPTQIIELNKSASTEPPKENKNFEDAPTQIIELNKSDSTEPPKENTNFEDLCTQVLEVVPPNPPEKLISEEMVNFKVPKISLLKKNSRTSNEAPYQCMNTDNKSLCAETIEDDDEKYYAATQELFNDLCSQQVQKPDDPVKCHEINRKSKTLDKHENKLINHFKQDSPESIDVEAKIDKFVSNLSCSQLQKDVGIEKEINVAQKETNQSLDDEVTPKKINCLLLLNTDLPNTQEIKTGITLISTDSDKEIVSDKSEHNSDKDSTIKSKDKKKLNKIKINLSEKFNPKTLPAITRSSNRVRKTTSKMNNFKATHKTVCENQVKPLKAHESKMDKFLVKEKRMCNKRDLNIRKSESHSYSTNTNNVTDCNYIQDNTAANTDKDEIEIKNSHSSLNTVHENYAPVTNNIETYLQSKNIVTEETNSKRNSSRGTRSRSKQKVEIASKKTKSPEKKESKSERENLNKNSRKPRTDVKKQDTQKPQTEVRRSGRNRKSKKSEEISSKVNHEHSTVYSIANLSLDSSADSPNKLKRPATCDPDFPAPKKSRTELTVVNNSNPRATPARRVKTHYILFTAFPCEEVKCKLEKLGAVVVTDVMECTVVLTLQIKRTFKFLCAVGLGKPIVGPNWVQACVDTNIIVDPWMYLIKDEATEKRFQFNLHRTLAGKREFLKGFNVSSTPGVMPSAPEMKMIVECSGGKWKDEGPNWICVSASADKHLWAGLKKKGAMLVSTEFILGGVLRQKLDIDKNKLT